jgi:hypothetical protein
MDPVINSVLQSPLARNLNHIPTDSTQFTYHVEQNAPPMSLKKAYIDSSQSFVGFDQSYTFSLPQWGYVAKNILRLQYQIKPLQRTHVTPVLPMYHMIDKVELMSHNNVIETLYGDSIMIKHAYYSEEGVAATKMMGTLNVPPESSSYVDIAALFRDSTTGQQFNPFDHTQWNNTTNVRTVTLFLELPFSFCDNPAMYLDSRFVEFLTVQVKLNSTKHGLPLFQAACAVELDMGGMNLQLDPTKHKNDVTHGVNDQLLNWSSNYEDKVSGDQNKVNTGASTRVHNDADPQVYSQKSTLGVISGKVDGPAHFYYRPYYSRCIGGGVNGIGGYYCDGSFKEADAAYTESAVEIRIGAEKNGNGGTGGGAAATEGLDPMELQLGGRPGSRLPSRAPVWMKGFYPAADADGVYACAHAGEPRYIRIGACNFDPAHYKVGYWGFLEKGRSLADKDEMGHHYMGYNSKGLGQGGEVKPSHENWKLEGRESSAQSGTINTKEEYCYSDWNIRDFAALWAQFGGAFVYSKKSIYCTKDTTDTEELPPALIGNARYKDLYKSSNANGAYMGDEAKHTNDRCLVNIDTKIAVIERFYAMYPYLNLGNQPTTSGQQWEGSAANGSNKTSFGHGKMSTSGIIIEGSQNNAASEGLPQKASVNMKLLVTYLSLHDRVREQISMDNYKDNMPATILFNDTFKEYDGILYGTADSPWATSTDQTMVVPIRSKNLAYAISIVAYRHRTDEQLVGGSVYNSAYNGAGPTSSRMDVCMTKMIDGGGHNAALNSIQDSVGLLTAQSLAENALGGENHQAGDLTLDKRMCTRMTAGGQQLVTSALGTSSAKTRWHSRKAELSATGAASTSAQNALQRLQTPNDGLTVDTWQGKGPCVLSDPTFTWPNYKVVENFKTVKPTAVKLSIAGQSVYETAAQTAVAGSYYATSSDGYTPIKGGGQWYVEKDLDNLPFHYNKGPQQRGEMGSVARLPNIVGSSEMGGSLQEHCDAHVITFGLNKTDQLSYNGGLGLSSATNAQLELKFAEPCRVSVYVHYHATLQIDSNTGVMSRSLDV